MGIAILSPCLFDNKNLKEYEAQQLHAIRLSELLNHIRKHFNFEIEEYRKAPYSGYCMKIPKYGNFILDNYIMTNVFAVIQKMIKKDKYINLEDVEPVECITPMELTSNEHTEAFLCYLNYAKSIKDKVLFIGEENMRHEVPFSFKEKTKFDVSVSKEVIIELSSILLPYMKDDYDWNSIFPRKEACLKYNKHVMEKISRDNLGQPEKISLFHRIGEIVALYNGYKRDERLCRINSSSEKKRTVFKKIRGKTFYLSIDIESGGFEVFDSSYKHLGQYNFSCDKSKEAEPIGHKLYQ